MSKNNRMGPDTTGGYSGEPLFREGGVRGGGVSALETMPAAYEYPKKQGYDEHRPARAPGEGTIHGEPGVEGIRADDDAPPDSDGDHDSGEGYGCPVGGCGFSAKTPHGLARHASKKHGATALGHALRA